MFSKVKCLHCGKEEYRHNAKTRACPIGVYSRTLGYTQYSATQVFEANPRSKPKEPKLKVIL